MKIVCLIFFLIDGKLRGVCFFCSFFSFSESKSFSEFRQFVLSFWYNLFMNFSSEWKNEIFLIF